MSINSFGTFTQKHSTELFCIICFLLVNLYLFTLLAPFYTPIGGHDYMYHYQRVEAVKYNIENFEIFSGIDYLYFGGGGYAGFAYPELFLVIPALLRIAGVGISQSMAVLFVLCNVFTYCFMFIFVKNISNSPVCAAMGASLYVLFTYRLDNIITRFALGEVLACVFWPLILYGLYDFIFGDFKKPYIIGIGFVGMLMSHTISTMLALGLAVIFSVVFIRRILKAPKKLPRLFITAGIAVAVTAYYWLPLLELLLSCEMSVKESPYDLADRAFTPLTMFKQITNSDIAGIGFPIFLLCVPRIFLTKNSPAAKQYLYDESTQKSKDILVFADTSLIIGTALALLSTNLISWKFLSKFLNFIQFP